MRNKSFAERVADVLIEDGLLLPSQLEEAVGVQQTEGGRLLKILTDKQFVTDQDMTVSMGRCLNTPLINLSKVRVPEEIMSLVPRDLAKANKLVPIARVNGKLFVAMADPTNVLAVDDVKRRVQLDIVPMIATERSVHDVLAGVWRRADDRSVEAGADDAQAAGEVEVNQEERRDRPRPAGDRQRRRAGHQDRQPDPGPGG
jgi:type IV pilus assembly protein PilB